MSKKEIIDVKSQNLGLNNKLKNVKFEEAFDAKKLEKAEQQIGKSEDMFLQATRDDMLQLKKIFERLSAKSVRAEVEKMQDLAFSIKSRAATAGFPLASTVAKSLFEFCEKKVEELNEEKYSVAKVHMNALDQILSDSFDSNDEQKTQKLIAGLSQITAKLPLK